MTAIVGDGRNVYVDVQQLGVPGAGRGRAVQGRLRRLGQIDAQILDAVLVNAGVLDLVGMNAHGFPPFLRNARGRVDLLRHGVYLLNGFKQIAYIA